MHDWEVKGKDSILRARVGVFRDELRRQILGRQAPFEAEVARSARPVSLEASVGLARAGVREGEEWGRDWDSGYFRLRAAVPPEWEGEELAAWLDFGGEALVYSRRGEPLYGLSNGSAFDVHYAKDVYRLDGRAVAGAEIELFAEAAASALFGIDPAPSPASKGDPARHGSRSARTRRMRLCVFDREIWALSLDVSFLLDLLDDLDPRGVRAARILRALFAASCAHRGESRNASLCRSILAPELAKPAAASALSTTVVGHAHIDTAWLWRTVETRRKVARTFASQLDLIGKYPGYVFGASAPQHHQWIKEDHPGTYSRILEAYRDGRWEPQGGMWVEADCNLASGESLVRQLLHGQGFWMSEFGAAARSCWIPDVFGYPASLPQILRKAGIEWFLTQKMSWSKLDEFPHDSFVWRGIDGSGILTHFPPEYTYNSYCAPRGLRKAEATFHEKAFLDEFVTLMGIGDGGGGPKEEHLENVLRSRDVEGLPKASFGGSTGFFERLAARSAELPTWTGELYLEYHRGTYTSQARIKRDNRRLEQELRAAEALLSCLPAIEWPAAELERAAKILLLHQFHDILPGSSIAAVYADARAAHAEAFDLLAEAEARAARRLCPEDEESLTFFNCLAQDFDETIELPPAWGASAGLRDESGSPVDVQSDPAGAAARIRVPPLGFARYARAPGRQAVAAAPLPCARDGDLVLDNGLARYRFDRDGELLEAIDLELGRPILARGAKGNVLSFYEDTPHDFDAWDIDHYYPSQLIGTARSGAAPEAFRGPARSGIRFQLEVGSSRIVQDALLCPGSKALTFRTSALWRESRRMLRASFPIATRAAEAMCDIQFGYVGRPTHANTSWDEAKFEFCAHRYVDLSDPGFGVALLNDCKYGYSARDNVLGLTLLRSPLYPDPDADWGEHEFAYVLYPHAGSLIESDVMLRAAALNRRPLAFPGRRPGPLARPPIALEGDGISLEALKKAERADTLVARLVETRGAGARAVLRCAAAGARARETDLIERPIGDYRPIGGGLEISLEPFEIKTFEIAGA